MVFFVEDDLDIGQIFLLHPIAKVVHHQLHYRQVHVLVLSWNVVSNHEVANQRQIAAVLNFKLWYIADPFVLFAEAALVYLICVFKIAVAYDFCE